MKRYTSPSVGRAVHLQVAATLMELSEAYRLTGLPKEGIAQAKEALEIYERLGHTVRQAECLIKLARLLDSDKQLDAAKDAAFRAIALLPEKGEEYRACRSHRALGTVYQSKGKTEKAIYHFEVALGIASPFNWHDDLFWIHYDLAGLFRRKHRFNDAQSHIECAKSHTVNSPYHLGYATEGQAWIWYHQHRLEEAESEALRAAHIYEKLGATKVVEDCRKLVRKIEIKLNARVASGQSGFDCELL